MKKNDILIGSESTDEDATISTIGGRAIGYYTQVSKN
jgi:hypothetical protein